MSVGTSDLHLDSSTGTRPREHLI